MGKRLGSYVPGAAKELNLSTSGSWVDSITLAEERAIHAKNMLAQAERGRVPGTIPKLNKSPDELLKPKMDSYQYITMENARGFHAKRKMYG